MPVVYVEFHGSPRPMVGDGVVFRDCKRDVMFLYNRIIPVFRGCCLNLPPNEK